jgi:hypothetical protein
MRKTEQAQTEQDFLPTDLPPSLARERRGPCTVFNFTLRTNAEALA